LGKVRDTRLAGAMVCVKRLKRIGSERRGLEMPFAIAASGTSETDHPSPVSVAIGQIALMSPI